MSDFLSQLKSKPAPFKGDGFEVILRPITFDERQELFAWLDANKDSPLKGTELEPKLVALTLCDADGKPLLGEKEVRQQIDPDKIDAIAREAGIRCGLYKEDPAKKAQPPSGSTNPETASPANSPSPAA